MVNSEEVVVWRVTVKEGEKCKALVEEEGGNSETAQATADGECLPVACSPYWVTACTQECNVAISSRARLTSGLAVFKLHT